jgi:hypothetical protein
MHVNPSRAAVWPASRSVAKAVAPPAVALEPLRQMPGFSNSSDNLRSEIRINGVAVGRVYNGGVIELADPYGSLIQGMEGLGEGAGPDYADRMIGGLKKTLAKFNAEFEVSTTALTQEQWLRRQREMGQIFVDRYA